MLEPSLLALLFAATLYMTGVIWLVQLVHYPLMRYVAPETFREYSLANQSRTTWVVGPGMLVEAVTTAGLVALRPGRLVEPCFAGAAILLAVVWLSTAFWQVPYHSQLLAGYDRERIQRLTRSNWLRTWAWTARAVLVGFL